MDLSTFTEQYLQIDQTIRGPLAYGIDSSWYNKFQTFLENFFEGTVSDLSDLEPISNNSIANKYEEMIDIQEIQETATIKKLIKNTFSVKDIQASYNILKECGLRHQSTVMRDYIVVNKDLWRFFLTAFGGGPQIPLYTIPDKQTTQISSSQKQEYIQHINIENIPHSLVIPTRHIRIMVIIQVFQKTFTGVHLFVPVVLRLFQLYEIIMEFLKECKEISQIVNTEWEIYLPNDDMGGQWYSTQCQQFLYDLSFQEEDIVFLVEGSMKSFLSICQFLSYSKEQGDRQQGMQVQGFDENPETHYQDKKNTSTGHLQSKYNDFIGPSTKDSQDQNNSLNNSNNSEIVPFNNNDQDQFQQQIFTQEIEDVNQLILKNMQDPFKLTLLPLEEIRQNLFLISEQIESEQQVQKKK